MTESHQLILSHGNKYPGPRPGVEIVALGAGDPVALKGGRGLTISERMFGKYKAYVEVDISKKSYTRHSRLPSKAASMFFDATVQVTYRAVDSATIAKNAVENGEIATWRLLEPALQKSTLDADATKVKPAMAFAEAAAAEVRHRIKSDGDLGIEISDVSVLLQPEAKTLEIINTLDSELLLTSHIEATERIAATQRKLKAKVIDGGPREWLADIMRNDPNAIREVLNKMAVAEKERHDADMQLLLKMLDNGEIESHEIPKQVKEDFIQSVMQRARAGDALALLNLEGKATPSPTLPPPDTPST